MEDEGEAEGSAAPAARPAKALPRCKCGHDRTHHMVSPSADYTFWGWTLNLIGITATPIRLRFRCRRCDQQVEVTSDPDVIRETRLWG